MDIDIKILKQDEEVSFDDAGKVVTHIRVLFKVGADGPFTKRFEKDTYSGAAARLELETFGRELRAIRG